MNTPENNPVSANGLSFQHNVFVNNMIAHGNRRIAYLSAYPQASESTARINACKLMKDDRIIYAIEQAKLQKQIAKTANPKEIRKAERISKMRNVLDGILNGSITTQQVVTTATGKVKHIKNTTDINALVNAIKSYDKLEALLDHD